VSRSGYTGEDGSKFPLEARIPNWGAGLSWASRSAPHWLGSRDSLRLERGLCLYGHDIDETILADCGGPCWVIGKRRKMAPRFSGRRAADDTSFSKDETQSVGLARATRRRRAKARKSSWQGCDRSDASPAAVTAPKRAAPIAMGYVDTEFAADENRARLLVRASSVPAYVAPLPFVPHDTNERAEG